MAANGERMPVKVSGRCVVGDVDFGEALVPTGLVQDLLSPGQFCDVDPAVREVVYRAGSCEFKERGRTVLAGERERGGQWLVSLGGASAAGAVATGCARAMETRAQKRASSTSKLESQRPRDEKRTRACARAVGTRSRQRGVRPGHGGGHEWPTPAEVQRGSGVPSRERSRRGHGQRKLRRAQHVQREQQAVQEQERLDRDTRAERRRQRLELQQRELEVGKRAEEEALRLHCKLGHLNLKAVRRMVKDGREKVSPACVKWLAGKTKFGCTHCGVGKTTKKPLPGKRAKGKKQTQSERARQRGLRRLRKKRVKEVRMGMDLGGPHVRAVGMHAGSRYQLLLRKQETRFSWLRFLKKKDAGSVYGVLEVLLPLVLSTLKKNERCVILTDLGSEWVSERVENLMSSLGIEHRYTSRDSSLSNGIVERHFRTLEQDVATALSQSGLSAGYWAELMETAHHTRLHLPCQGLPDNRSPFEHETGKDSAPFRALLQPVGCLAVGRRIQRTSMGARGEEFVYLGPQVGSKDGHRLLDLETRRVVRDRSVAVFDVTTFPALQSKAMRKERRQERLLLLDALGLLEEDEASGALPELVEESSGSGSDDEEEDTVERPMRERRQTRPATYDPDEIDAVEALVRAGLTDREGNVLDDGPVSARLLRALYTSMAGPIAAARASVAQGGSGPTQADPTNFSEAMKYAHWRKAFYSEVAKLWKNGTFRWERAPQGAKILGNQVVWKTKRDESNRVTKHKARVVARGDGQKKGDGTFSETFAPTVRMDTVRMLFALAVERGWKLGQADVESAFLIPFLSEDEVIYMRPPPGVEPPPGKEGCVLRLLKSLYGIKQAPRKWNKEMHEFLLSAGYEQSVDPCLFLKRDHASGEVLSAVLFHVDDVLCAASDEERAVFMRALGERFPITDLGEPTHFLGIRVSKLPGGGYAWSQEAYLDRVLERFNMTEARPRRTPISARLYREEGESPADAVKYRQLVGALMYLMICTRPDIAFAVNQLTRHFQSPQMHHWKAALRVLAYLKTTRELGLSFPRGCGPAEMEACFKGCRDLTDAEGSKAGLVGWSDADWAGDEEDRKSTTGYAVQLRNGTLLSYGCRKQSITADSSAVAELIALNSATKEVLWQKRLFVELFGRDAGTVSIKEDNVAAKTLAESHRFSHKTKHLATRYFFCREKVDEKEVSVDWVKSSEQTADIFTKPLGEQIFVPLRAKLGMVVIV